jgi:hypothetical protein
MKNTKPKSRSEWMFNIEIFKNQGAKEIKISNMPIVKLDEVVNDLKEKYG